MIWSSLLLCSLAIATPPGVRDLAHDLVAITPVEVHEAWPATWHAQPEPIAAGQLLVVRLTGKEARPRQTSMPVVYVDTRPLEVLGVAPDGDCIVGLTATRGAGFRLFLGPDRLPSLVDHAYGLEAAASAERAGVGHVDDQLRSSRLTPPAHLADAAELEARAVQLLSLCSAEETARPSQP